MNSEVEKREKKSKRDKKRKWKEDDEEIKSDARFKDLHRDPRFRPLRVKDRKIKVDDRFKAMLTDSKFNLTHKVDPRGRPSAVKSSAENMRKFYELEDEGKEKGDESENEDLRPDYARGEAALESSSEDESSSDEEGKPTDDTEQEVEHPWGELDADAPRCEEANVDATRIAVCNMDWDRLTAKDLAAALSSFLSGPTASLKSVTIYKSQFGKERMALEEVSGPVELVGVKEKSLAELGTKKKNKKKVKEHVEDADANASDDEEMREKVRTYQLNRLRYFYAIAEFDSPETVNHVYEQCDGVEYESSATRFDLRIVPNGETFDEADAVDVCKVQAVDFDKYEPHLFVNTALQQGKVRCTWDENDPRREKTIEKIFKNLNPKSKREKKALKRKGVPTDVDGMAEEDWRAYLASSSSEEEEEVEEHDEPSEGRKKKVDRIEAYKQLLTEIKSKEEKEEKDKAHMEISWHPVDVEPVKELMEKKEKKEETPWDRYLAKLKEKKHKKKTNEGEDDEVSNELTNEELNDPFFASSNLDDEKDYDPMRMVKKQRKREKIEEKEEDKGLDLLAMDMDEDESGRKHFNLDRLVKLEKLKSKKKLKKQDRKKLAQIGAGVEDDFKVDLEDKRFSAVYSSHEYNVDPSDPMFKATPGMKALLEEKRKRKKESLETGEKNGVEGSLGSALDKTKAEMRSLVQSVKRKAGGSKKV